MRDRTRPTLVSIDVIASAGVVFTVARFHFCLVFIYRIDLKNSVSYLHETSLYTVAFVLVASFVPVKSLLYSSLGWAGRRRLSWPATVWLITLPIIHVTGTALMLTLCTLQYQANLGDVPSCVRLYGPLPQSFSNTSEITREIIGEAKKLPPPDLNRTGKLCTNNDCPPFSYVEKCGFFYRMQEKSADLGTKWRQDVVLETGRKRSVLVFNDDFDLIHAEDRHVNLLVARFIHLIWMLLIFPFFWVQVKRYFKGEKGLTKRRPRSEAALSRFFEDRLTKKDVLSNYTSSNSECDCTSDNGDDDDGNQQMQIIHRVARKRKRMDDKTEFRGTTTTFVGRPLQDTPPAKYYSSSSYDENN